MGSVIKIALGAFLVFWVIVGFKLIVNYERLFGPHPDDPAESSGARSFGVAHIVAVWVGAFALALYFLFK